MKAVVFTSFGNDGVLSLQNVEFPELQKRHLIIQVHACSVNPMDWKIREGHWAIVHSRFPFVPGFDFAGVVAKVHPSCSTKFAVGDQVFGISPWPRCGAYAEYLSILEDYVLFKPYHLSFSEAASLPFVSLAAWKALVAVGNLQKGQKILILGGSGGCGLAAIQIAANIGAFVAATARSEYTKLVKERGADLVIDFTRDKFDDADMLAESDYDMVFDTVGEEGAFTKAVRVLKNNGLYVTTVCSELGQEPVNIENSTTFFFGSFLFRKFAEFVMGAVKYRLINSTPNIHDLDQIHTLISREILTPTIDSTYSILDAAKAQAHCQKGHKLGKIVLDCSQLHGQYK